MEDFNHVFFALKGRIGRRTFWWASIAVVLLETGLGFLLALIFQVPIFDLTGPELTNDQWMAVYDKLETLGALVNVIFVWPWIAIIGKRCHDRNKSALWTLLAYVPIIGNLWALIDLGLLRGTRGANRFGADPLVKP